MKLYQFLLCIALLVWQTAFADLSHLSSDPQVKQARALTEKGEYAAALDILRALPADHPDQTDVFFLRGFAALQLSEQIADEAERNHLLNEATRFFRAILFRRPELTRIRLELARAFFLLGEDALARQNFNRVLAGKPPAAVVANINRFIAAMDARQRWSSYFNVAVAPEARVEHNRTIYFPFAPTLPFILDEGKKSGHGLVFTAGASYHHSFSERWSLLSGVDLKRTEYKGHDFDSGEIKLYTGPRFTFSRGNDIHLGMSFRRDFDGDGININDVYELSLRGNRRWSSRLSGGGGASASWDKFGNGPDSSFSLDSQYFFTPTLLGRIKGGMSFSRPKIAANRSRSRQIELSSTFLLPYGFTANLLGGAQWTDYKSRFLVLNGKNRKGKIRTLQLGLLNRGWTLFGFSPQLTFIRQISDTNYQLNRYKSTSYQLDFKQQF